MINQSFNQCQIEHFFDFITVLAWRMYMQGRNLTRSCALRDGRRGFCKATTATPIDGICCCGRKLNASVSDCCVRPVIAKRKRDSDRKPIGSTTPAGMLAVTVDDWKNEKQASQPHFFPSHLLA